MIKIWLIRHGMTEGNRHQRYIGVTDEPLCPEGIERLKNITYPKPQAIFVSPLRRCQETAEILFPEQKVRIIDQLAECNFGAFENKNYKELSDDPRYQAWIDSNGIMAFPGGESKEECAARNLEGFQRVVTVCIQGTDFRSCTCRPWRYDHEYHGEHMHYRKGNSMNGM